MIIAQENTVTENYQSKRTSSDVNHPSFNFKLPGITLDDILLSTSESSATTISNTSHQSDNKQIPLSINVNPMELKLNEPLAPTIGFLSELSRTFAVRIFDIINSRHIFCSEEYPSSFTGEEAINTLIGILGIEWSRKDCKRLANTMMTSNPPLFLPILYSTKSLSNNAFYDSSKEVYTINEEADLDTLQYVQGLLTPSLECYTPLCAKFYSNGCYAYYCPNRGSKDLVSSKKAINLELQRNLSLTSSLVSSQVSSQDTLVSRSWATIVSRETFQMTPPKEMKRQEAIYELIYTEEDYVRDLVLLDELFAKPLSIAQCIETERRESFCKEVFGNYDTILKLHQNMYRELRDYQLTSQDIGIKGKKIGFIDQIAMILVKYVEQFMDIYTTYGPQFIIAEYTIAREMATNMLFQNFIREKEKQAEARKLPFRHYIILPLIRLQRYPILLEAILKRTTDEVESSNLRFCIQHIREVAFKVDTLTNETKQLLDMRKINDRISFKPGSPVYPLDLLNPKRSLIYQGPLKRRSNLGVDYVELYVFLFDHLLLMTKPRRNPMSKDDDYVVSKSPIPLSLLMMGDVSDGSLFASLRSGKGNSANRNSFNAPRTAITQSPTHSSQLTSEDKFPEASSLLIRHLGRHGGDYILLADSISSKLSWREKIISTQKQWVETEKKRNVFKVTTLNHTQTFTNDNLYVSNKFLSVTCATSFTGYNNDKMIAVGMSQGVWISKENDRDSFKKVLEAENVTHIDFLPSHNILLVLADKVLTAYPISQLDPTNPGNAISRGLKHKKHGDKTPLISRELHGNAHYFNTGTYKGKTLVVVMRRKGHDSHFKAFEPVCGNLSDLKNQKYISSKTFFMAKPVAWFKVYKEFYVGSESASVHFLKSKLLIQCSYGFELLDLENLSDVKYNLPDLRNNEFSFVSSSRSLPLNIFKFNENFLVCYDQFFFRITSHGELIKKNYKRIKWEGQPKSVAFCHPFVFGFDSNFIEIRHAESGKLVQVVVGDQLRQLPSALNNTNTTGINVYATMTTQCQNIIKFEQVSP